MRFMYWIVPQRINDLIELFPGPLYKIYHQLLQLRRRRQQDTKAAESWRRLYVKNHLQDFCTTCKSIDCRVVFEMLYGEG
jgi:hypothetical protein